MSEHIKIVNPESFARPKGYANGVIATGRTLYIAGQVGWEADETFASRELVPQFIKALDNVLAVVEAAGGKPTDVVKMTVFVTDLEAYSSGVRDIGAAWRERFGKHFPAMALVGVAGLIEQGAMVEIEAIASLAHG